MTRSSGVRIARRVAISAAANAKAVVVDVWLDRDEAPVRNPRNASLVEQGLSAAQKAAASDGG